MCPTGDGFRRFIPGEFPTRAMIRITYLPVLLDSDELEELLKLPEITDLKDNLERENSITDASTVYTRRARISIFINSQKHEEKLFNWSMRRKSVDGQMVWNEIPIYMSNPRLDNCSKCEAEGRHQFLIGHGDQWCRILRKTTDPMEEDSLTPKRMKWPQSLKRKHHSIRKRKHTIQKSMKTQQEAKSHCDILRHGGT